LAGGKFQPFAFNANSSIDGQCTNIPQQSVQLAIIPPQGLAFDAFTCQSAYDRDASTCVACRLLRSGIAITHGAGAAGENCSHEAQSFATSARACI
jgi:hypothetical protein